MVTHMKKSLLLIVCMAAVAALAAQGPSGEARALYEESLRAIGRATTRQELQAAARLLEGAKRTDPEWAEIHFALGRVYEALDVYDRAAEGYEGYLELAAAPPDRDEVLKRVRACRQRHEWLEEDKRLLASGTWNKVYYMPPVRFNQPVVSSRFRIDSKGHLFARNPWLEILGNQSSSWVKDEWSPVSFDGRYFEYEYRVYFKALDPPRVEYTIERIRGEVIPGSPCRVRQTAYHASSPTLFPDRAGMEELVGEVLHEVR
jgi:tetratricopeptide (TPR) repeat protein